MKVVVIDGQGGRMGSQLVEKLKQIADGCQLVAIGTNSVATAAMLRAGAIAGATGENPAIVACRDADVIVGPLGILAADSLMGEVTPAMAVAVGQSPAAKVLLPVNRCNHYVVGAADLPMAEAVRQAADQVLVLLRKAASPAN